MIWIMSLPGSSCIELADQQVIAGHLLTQLQVRYSSIPLEFSRAIELLFASGSAIPLSDGGLTSWEDHVHGVCRHSRQVYAVNAEIKTFTAEV